MSDAERYEAAIKAFKAALNTDEDVRKMIEVGRWAWKHRDTIEGALFHGMEEYGSVPDTEAYKEIPWVRGTTPST